MLIVLMAITVSQGPVIFVQKEPTVLTESQLLLSVLPLLTTTKKVCTVLLTVCLVRPATSANMTESVISTNKMTRDSINSDASQVITA